MTAQILLIEKLESGDGTASFVARCHAGVLRLGDCLTIAVDPAGDRHSANVRCVEIRLTKRILVDELETNFGGLIVLEGADVSYLSANWTLSSE